MSSGEETTGVVPGAAAMSEETWALDAFEFVSGIVSGETSGVLLYAGGISEEDFAANPRPKRSRPPTTTKARTTKIGTVFLFISQNLLKG